jgi:L-aspartate oxidase
MKRLGIDSVFLDISHKSKDFIMGHFPNVYAMCRKFGYDMSKEPVPVVPAAHYTCGGLMVDKHGHTDIDGLYAIGETTFTGLHGANRMASNSLLECVVYGQACAKELMKRCLDTSNINNYDIPDWDESRVTDSDERVVINHNWVEVRRFMWDYVGIVRTSKRLQRARTRIEMLLSEIDEYYSNFRVTSDLVELRNLAEVARLIIRSAQQRKESRGLHYTLDYPEPDPKLSQVNSILDPIKRSRS